MLTSFCLTEFSDLSSSLSSHSAPLLAISPSYLLLLSSPHLIFRSSLNLSYNSFLPCSPHQAYKALFRLFLKSSHIHCGSLSIPKWSLIILRASHPVYCTDVFSSFVLPTDEPLSLQNAHFTVLQRNYLLMITSKILFFHFLICYNFGLLLLRCGLSFLQVSYPIHLPVNSAPLTSPSNNP